MTDHSTADASSDSVYAGLLEGDPTHWAFGTDFEDPLAGVDTTVPDGADAADLAEYALMLADDVLIMSHRLSEWCSYAPELEEDIALANTALDLLGQARLLLARAAAANSSIVPQLPPGSPVPAEDALAYFRDQNQFRNVRLVESENDDFAVTIVRLLLFATWRLAVFDPLRNSGDPVLAAVANKGIKELTYHGDYAGRWFVTLAQGTAESRRRLTAAIDAVWPLHSELYETHPVERRVADAGIGVDPAEVRAAADRMLDDALSAADIARPDVAPLAGVRGCKGRSGLHTEALSYLLAEMQSVARAHPMGRW